MTVGTTDDSRFAVSSQEVPAPIAASVPTSSPVMLSVRDHELTRKFHELLASPLGEGVALIVEESYRMLPLLRHSS
jgi:hypothetical protein